MRSLIEIELEARRRERKTKESEAKDEALSLALDILAVQDGGNTGSLSAVGRGDWFDDELINVSPGPSSSERAEYTQMAVKRIGESDEEIKLWSNIATAHSHGRNVVRKFLQDKQKEQEVIKLQQASKALADAAEKIKSSQASTGTPHYRKRKYEEAFEGVEEILAETTKDLLKHKKHKKH